MDWEPFVTVATLIVVIVTLIWGAGLWTRREKVKIRVTGLSDRVDGVERQISVYLGIEFRRSGGNDIRYISRVLRKPDQEIYGQLRQYFELPSDGMMKWDTRIELPRDKFVSSFNNLEPLTYKALPSIQSGVDRDKATQIASQLSQKSYKIGLVWEDNGKTVWKTISTECRGKWV